MPNKPLLTWRAFKKAHLDQNDTLKRYATTRGRDRVTDEIALTLKNDGKGLLYATSAMSRLALGKVLKELIGRAAGGAAFKNIYFVTLTPSQFAVPMSSAHKVDVAMLKEWATHVLNPDNFIAIVEAAHYSNFGVAPRSDEPAISWHVHALVWGPAEGSLPSRIESLNRVHRSLVPGCPCGHVRQLTRGQVLGRALYMCKAPLDDHRVYPMRTERVAKNTGEVRTFLTGEFRQRKRRLRPGQAISMVGVFGALRVPDLLFAGGAGKSILARVLTRLKRKAGGESAHA